MMLSTFAPALAILWVAQVISAPAPDARTPLVETFPSVEDVELLSVAGLPTIRSEGDVIRYVLRRGFGYGTKQSARIVQADWAYKAEHPRVLSIELAKRNGAWQVIDRNEAAIEPTAFNRLIDNVAAAASVLGQRPDRGTSIICSHSDTSRLDLSIPDERMRVSRGAHCSGDAPAVVAGKLLTTTVDSNLQRDRSTD